MMSLGKATHQIAPDSLRETAVSQMFVVLNPAALGPAEDGASIADAIVESLHKCRAGEDGKKVRYPGEQTLRTREENRRLGLPVDPAVWAEIVAM